MKVQKDQQARVQQAGLETQKLNEELVKSRMVEQ